MKNRKPHPKDQRPKRKESVEDKFHHSKVQHDKVKYKHKNHWLEEDEEVVVNIKKKKKPKV